MTTQPPRLPDLPLPSDPDLALPDIYVPPAVGAPSWSERPAPGRPGLRPPVGERDVDRPLPRAAVALTRTIPAALVVVMALAVYLARDALPVSDLPLPLLLIVAVQVAGYLVGRANDLWPWARTCLANAAIVLVLVPLLAIQASATRTPYVSPDFGTDRPAILATVAAAVGLIVLAVAAVATAWETPEDSALYFLPAALLVPALLGSDYAVTADALARLLAEVYFLAAVATFFGLVAPRLVRPLVGPLCLAAYFALLLLFDRGPTREPTSEELARVLDGSLLGVAMVLTLGVPVAALGVRRVMREVLAVERARLFDRIARE